MEKDIVERLREGFYIPGTGMLNEAADIIERMRKALIPFANEASHWVNYQDDERLVESFPGYEGDITVGNLRDAYDAMVNK